MTSVQSEKYKQITMSGRNCIAFTGFLKNENLRGQIDFVKIWTRENSTNVIRGGSNNIIGAVIGGVLGAIASTIVNRNSVTITCTVFLINGDYFTVETDDKELIQYLIQFAEVGRKYNVRGQAV